MTDTVFALSCGCLTDGRSGSHAARRYATRGLGGQMLCGTHGAVTLAGIVALNEPAPLTQPDYWPAELEEPCGGCGHQSGCHTKGAGQAGWAVYDRVWRLALGACSTLGCGCPARETEAGTEPLREAA